MPLPEAGYKQRQNLREQCGICSLHDPLAKHVVWFDPFNIYPGRQLKLTRVKYVTFKDDSLLFFGAVNFVQAATARQKRSFGKSDLQQDQRLHMIFEKQILKVFQFLILTS